MNSKKSGDLRCGKETAFKKVKGFTLLELIIVMAIIAILAGISSSLITGYLRDANTEAANSKAKLIYSSIQSALVQCEINNDTTFLDPNYIKNGTSSAPKYVDLRFHTDEYGNIIEASVVSGSNSATYSDADSAAECCKTSYSKLKIYIDQALASDFAGSVYASIDLENFVVNSVLYCEFNEGIEEAIDASSGFANEYSKIGSSVGNVIYGCEDIYEQKSDYSETGRYIGFYPLMKDVVNEFKLVADNNPY